MERTIGVVEAGREFASIVQEVARGDNYVVESPQGEPVAALVPIELYEQLKKYERDKLRALIEEASQRANLSPEEAERLADEAVQAVRAAQRV